MLLISVILFDITYLLGFLQCFCLCPFNVMLNGKSFSSRFIGNSLPRPMYAIGIFENPTKRVGFRTILTYSHFTCFDHWFASGCPGSLDQWTHLGCASLPLTAILCVFCWLPHWKGGEWQGQQQRFSAPGIKEGRGRLSTHPNCHGCPPYPCIPST